MKERRGRQFDLSSLRRVAVLRNHLTKQLEFDAAQHRFVLFREPPPLLNQRANTVVPVEVIRVDPDQLVPHLQIANLFGGELRRHRAAAQSDATTLPLRQQFGVPGKRIDHARPMRVEELVDAVGALLVGQRLGGLQTDLQMPIARLFSRE
jgi:hypothetical protein